MDTPQKQPASVARIEAQVKAAKAAMQELRLLPCPFCNGVPILCYQRDDIGDYKVECQGCGAVSCPDGMRYDKEQAINDWNQRA